MQKNRIEIAGYLAAKPEARYLPSGTQVANARVAEGYRYTDRNHQQQDIVDRDRQENSFPKSHFPPPIASVRGAPVFGNAP